MAFVKRPELRIIQGAELVDYQLTRNGKPQPFLHLTFSRHCGVRAFTRGGSFFERGSSCGRTEALVPSDYGS